MRNYFMSRSDAVKVSIEKMAQDEFQQKAVAKPIIDKELEKSGKSEKKEHEEWDDEPFDDAEVFTEDDEFTLEEEDADDVEDIEEEKEITDKSNPQIRSALTC